MEQCVYQKLWHCLVTVWKDLKQHVIDIAFDQWRRRLTACVSANGRRSEQSL